MTDEHICIHIWWPFKRVPQTIGFNTKKEPHVELFDATYVFLRTPKVVDKVMFLEHQVFRTYAAIIS